MPSPSDSRSRKFSLKEALLLLLPCLVLAGLALALRGRGGNTIVLTNRFSLILEKHEFEPVTPREVSQGYSAKLKVTLNHVGPTPAWWGGKVTSFTGTTGTSDDGQLTYRDGGQVRPVVLSPNSPNIMFWHPRYDAKADRYIARFLIPLAQVPARKADVVLQAKVAITDDNQKRQCAPIPLTIVLRKAGAPVSIPRVSMDSNLAVKEIEVNELSPLVRKDDGYDTEVRITLRYTGAIDGENDPMKSMPIGSGQIVDSKGNSLGMSAMEFGGSPDLNHPDAPYIKTMVIRFSLAAIPRNAGALFYTENVSLNDGWPLKVRVPIRDAKGRRLLTQKRGGQSFLKILNTSVAPANSSNHSDGCDTQVSISLQHSAPQLSGGLKETGLKTDWSQHLVDEKGRKYWLFNFTYGKGNIRAESAAHGGNRSTVEYSFPLKQIPASVGRVWLKAEIAAGNNAFLPVSILVRDTPLPKS